MSKEQQQASARMFSNLPAKQPKVRKQLATFADITLFKQDLAELLTLFQTHLQDAEFFIDDQSILHSEKLAQFDDTYQAKSLLARGYWSPGNKLETANLEGRLLVELKTNTMIAIFSSWNTLYKSEFAMQLQKRLLRRTTFIQHTSQVFIFALLVSPAYSLASLTHQTFITPLSYWRIFIDIFLCILATVLNICLFTWLITRLKVATRNFLFPGKDATTHAYHRFNMGSRLLIALFLFIFIDGLLIVAIVALQRLWP